MTQRSVLVNMHSKAPSRTNLAIDIQAVSGHQRPFALLNLLFTNECVKLSIIRPGGNHLILLSLSTRVAICFGQSVMFW